MSKIRVGIFGAGRGMELAKSFMFLGTEIVALCDNHAERRKAAMEKLDKSVAEYDNFDEFIEHPKPSEKQMELYLEALKK